MTKKQQIIKELESIPDPILDEVLDFIGFLKKKTSRKRMETAIASESTLKKDWLSDAEDRAWRDL